MSFNPRMPQVLLFILLLIVLHLSACSSLQLEPDLALLYNDAARHESPDRNPIIVIPGMLGTKLMYMPKGSIAWGAFESGAADPSSSEGARIIALPIGSENKLNQMHDDVKPSGVLERLRINLAGISLNIQAYAGMLSTLGAGGYRDDALGMAGEIDYGDEHYTCFQFPYDWRRDNVENAQRLHAFIKEKQQYVRMHYQKRFGINKENIKFDIAAHSMGGLITRYFLRYGAQDLPDDGSLPQLNWAGAELVERVILVGAPNSGSATAFLHLIQGEQLSPILPYYPPALLGTFPSIYQLLPRPRHKAVIWDEDDQRTVDIFDPELWERMHWGMFSPKQMPMLINLMPEFSNDADRKKQISHYFQLVLNRAKQFQQALDQPSKTPEGLSIFLVGGDATETVKTISVNSSNGKHKLYKTGPGDETVLRSSALADERMTGEWQPRLQSPIDFQSVFFLPYNHLELTQNVIFRDNVLFWLLEDAR